MKVISIFRIVWLASYKLLVSWDFIFLKKSIFFIAIFCVFVLSLGFLLALVPVEYNCVLVIYFVLYRVVLLLDYFCYY